MGDVGPGLLHRVDCHASGIPKKHAVIAKDELEPLNLCAACLRRHADELIRQGWIIERLRANDDCDSEVVVK